jgi:ABC-type Zn uptake system ZnuABC Zn-binding protein ZnuA
MKMIFNFITTALLFTALLAGCGLPESAANNASEKLLVVATTTLVADVVRQVGGNQIEVQTLLPVGADPHSFQPTPQDLARLSKAELIFINGVGLEEFMTGYLENSGSQAQQFVVSEGIELLPSHPSEQEHTAGDPHTWTDPNLVMQWSDNIARALSEADPANAAAYQANAHAYRTELAELDTWIREQVATLPPEQRKLVTDHLVLGYFAARYGFTQVGAILPSVSTASEPTAQELAALQDMIAAQGVKAVFVGTTINPALAERLAEDTGAQLVRIYTGSLSEAGGPASTYLDFMRFNVRAFVEALK